MTREEAYNQYLHEVALFEQWGSKNITTFDEWLEIKNIKLETEPQGLDEAAIAYANSIAQDGSKKVYCMDDFKAGAKWMAGQGVTKECIVGMATKEIICTFTEETLDKLGVCPSDKVIIQIRKKGE